MGKHSPHEFIALGDNLGFDEVVFFCVDFTHAAYWISWLIFNLIILGACTYIFSYYMLKLIDWVVLLLYFLVFRLAQFGIILFC